MLGWFKKWQGSTKAAEKTDSTAEASPHSEKTRQEPVRQESAKDPIAAEVTVGDAEHPERIGPYKIVRILGEGGMARVYVAEYVDAEGTEPRQQYALKRLTSLEEDDAARFKREILIGLKLHHPNVCRVVDWGTIQDQTFYLVMELLEGQLLADLMEAMSPMPVAMARPIISQILVGLEAVHAAGIVHRDLKPGNIFLSQDGTVKIMDFGIARGDNWGSVTRTGSAIGTPEYISPEQLMDSKHVDARSDLFNVGVIAYAMLTRKLPTDAPNIEQMLMKLINGPLTPIGQLRPDLPPGLPPWIDRLLAHQRENRFQSAREALDAMQF